MALEIYVVTSIKKNEIDKQIEQKRNKLTYKGKKPVIARGEADRGLLK